MTKEKGNELTDADVKFLSLVPKGANKIPLKIKKSDKGKPMIDLNSLFTTGADAPFVAAVIVNKAADLEEAKERILKAGFSIDSPEDADGAIVFKQKDVPEGHSVFFIKQDEEVAFQVTAKKSFSPGDYEESSFKTLFSQAGVLPGINAAMDVLGVVIGNILFNQDTDTPESAASQIKAAVKEFSAMIVEMVSSVPVTAFKMDVKKSKAASKTKKSTEKDTTMTKKKEDEVKEPVAKTAEEIAAEAVEVEKAKAKPADKADAENAKDGGADDAEENADGSKKKKKTKKEEEEAAPTEEVKKSAEPTLADVMKALTGLGEQVTTLKTSTDAAIAEVKKEVGEVAKVAKSANEAIEGLALTDGEGDRTAVKKTAEHDSRPLVDTGYQRSL